jgi:hypothetical protein
MNALPRHPMNVSGREQDPGEIDGLLRRFFRAEMPDPWPAAPATGDPVSVPVTRPSRSLLRSRFALAASLLLLLVGHLSLSGRFADNLPNAPDSAGANVGSRHDASGNLMRPQRTTLPPKPGRAP